MTVAYAPSRDPLSKARRRVTQWRAARPVRLQFERPILSVCFDDFPASAANSGARILEAHGVRGSFYASAGLTGQEGPCGRHFTAGDVRRLAAAGHEIGCHTHAHRDCARMDAYDVLKDIAANRDALAEMGCVAPLTLAYPYGETSMALKQALSPRFVAARGVLPGLNAGAADLAQLRAAALFGRGYIGAIRADLKHAARRNAWMIVFTHDVDDAPSPWGARSSDLDALLRTAAGAGFAILPVAEALSRRMM